MNENVHKGIPHNYFPIGGNGAWRRSNGARCRFIGRPLVGRQVVGRISWLFFLALGRGLRSFIEIMAVRLFGAHFFAKLGKLVARRAIASIPVAINERSAKLGRLVEKLPQIILEVIGTELAMDATFFFAQTSGNRRTACLSAEMCAAACW